MVTELECTLTESHSHIVNAYLKTNIEQKKYNSKFTNMLSSVDVTND